jgi:hypothetical protein
MLRTLGIGIRRTCGLVIAMLATLATTGVQAQEPGLVPVPKTCSRGVGHLTLNAD